MHKESIWVRFHFKQHDKVRIHQNKRPLLLNIYNSCLDLGYFPNKWKIASVIILPKPNKPNYDSPNCYRPISLLPRFAKILEKFIHTKTSAHLISSPKYNKNQFGFTKGLSTISALDAIIDSALSHKYNNQLAAIIAVDIQGSFDNAFWPAINKSLDYLDIPSQLIHVNMS